MRTDSTRKWSHFAVQWLDDDGRFTSFAVVCFGSSTVVSFLVSFFFFFRLLQHLPFFPIDETKWQCASIFYQPVSQRSMELYSHTNGESETSVEGNSETVGFSSAAQTKESLRREIFRSWLVVTVFYESLGNTRVSFFLASQCRRERWAKRELSRFRCNMHGFFGKSWLSFWTSVGYGG